MASNEMDLFTGTPTGVVGGPGTDPEVQLSENLLQQYDQGERATWVQEATDDEAFANNVQWEQSEIVNLESKNQFPIVLNYLFRIIEQAVGMLTSNEPRWLSTAKENSDVRVGAIVSDLMEHVWFQSQGRRELKRVIRDYYTISMGALQVYWDPSYQGGLGEIFIRSIDPRYVYVSPDTDDPYGINSPHLLVKKVYSAEQYRYAFPAMAELIENARKTSVPNRTEPRYQGTEGQSMNQVLGQNQDYYEVIDRYSRMKVKITTVIDHSRASEKYVYDTAELEAELRRPVIIQIQRGAIGQPMYVTEPSAVAEGMKVFAQTGGVYHTRMDPESGEQSMAGGTEVGDPYAVPGSETVMQIATMGDLVPMGIVEIIEGIEDRVKRVLSVGGVLMWSGMLPCKDHPVILLMNNHHRNPYPNSDVRKARPLQRGINKIQSLLMAHLANSTNVKVFVPEGAVSKRELEEKWGKAGAQFFYYNPSEGKIEIAAPSPIAGEAYGMIDRLRRDMEDIMGVYSFMQGDPSGQHETIRGIMMQEEQGTRRSKSKQDDIEAFMNHCASVVKDFVQFYYTEHKVIRIVQPNNAEDQQVEVNIPLYDSYTKSEIGKSLDVSVGRYDLVFVSGSMLPTNRWARFEMYKSMLELGVIDDIELMKQTDVVDIQGVMKRKSMYAQMRDMIAQLQAENKKISGDLQTAQRESVQDRKRVEVEKFKSGLAEESARLGAATDVAIQRMGDELRNAKKELASEEPDMSEALGE